MPLQTNPEFQNVGTSWATVDAISAANGGGNQIYGNVAQAQLNDKIAELSGAPGSNLNYIAGQNPAGYNTSSSGVNSVASTAGSGSGGGGSAAGAGGGGGGGGGPDGLDSLIGGIATVVGLIGAAKRIGSGIQEAISGIKNAAGQANNLISKARAKNLPKGGELFQQTTGTSVQATNDQDWRVRLNCDYGTYFSSTIFDPLDKTGGVVWPYLPRVTIGYKANYTQVDPIHSNTPFQAYKNSQVDDIQISGEFSVQTEYEADYWIAVTHFLKTATKMFYGSGSEGLQGNPPVICRLSGYGSFVFNNVPVVIKSYSVDMPEDVNYINTVLNGSNHWVPAVSTISVTVSPVYNRERLRKFSLQDFASGGALSKGIM